MGEVILKTNIKRENGWIYYCGTDNGNLTICKAKMGRNKKKEEDK